MPRNGNMKRQFVNLLKLSRTARKGWTSNWSTWESKEAKQRNLVEARAFKLAQERYLVAHSDTDLDGQGSFAAIVPGNYWIGMLGSEAISGDVRLNWDFPVTVRRGETSRVELSNLNASKPSFEAHKSNP